jgi:hypothetical protein
LETLTLDVGLRPKLRLEAIGGDLRLVGQAGTMLRAQAPSKGDLKVVPRGDETVVTCASSCMIFLPSDAEIVVEAVDGDARVHALSGSLRFGQVNGDVSVRRCASLQAEAITGDLVVRKLDRGLAVRRVSGDGKLEQVDGGLEIGRIEGNLVVRDLAGALTCDAGGDVRLEWRPAPSSSSRLTCDGDLHCRLLPGASVTLQLQAAGDLDLGAQTSTPSPEGVLVVFGAGEAQAVFVAGGDLTLRGPAEESVFSELEGLQEDIDNLVRTKWEEALSGIDVQGLDAQRVAGEVRRAMEQVQSHLPRPPSAPRPPGKVSVTFSKPAGKTEPVSGDERLAILRMLEQGKINVDQAEQLLRALDANA